MPSPVGLKRVKGRSSVTRPQARTRVSSASRIASTSAPVCTNARSQVSKGSVYGDSLEEEDENRGYLSQRRDIPGKRAREMAEVRGETLAHYTFVLIVLFFQSQGLKILPLLPRSPALKVVSTGQWTPIQTPLVR
jgi:hypothetical protein